MVHLPGFGKFMEESVRKGSGQMRIWIWEIIMGIKRN
jgi:hypothetical protein